MFDSVPHARPATTEEAAELVRGAATAGWSVVVRGGGTKQDWALPPRAVDLVLCTERMTGIVEHAAGDLILVVRAGTPLATVADKLAAAHQQLALDDPFPDATIGGVVAVSASGPRRMLYGAVRDLLIGVTVVRADGAVAHAGGKVVKNVAGYDLGKLVAGSYGTLGMITQCAFRLHPLPAATACVQRDVGSPAEACRLAATVLGAQVVPSGIEIDAPPSGGYSVAVLLEGVAAGVAQRAATVARLLGPDAITAEEPPAWWGRYPWKKGDVGLKVSTALSRVGDVVRAARAPVALRGSVGSGVLYAGMPGDTDPGRAALAISELRAAARAGFGHCVVLTAPPAIRDRVDVWGPVDGLDLMRRVKAQFDPHDLWAPGRFVGGI